MLCKWAKIEKKSSLAQKIFTIRKEKAEFKTNITWNICFTKKELIMAYNNYISAIKQNLDADCKKELEKWGFIAQLDGNRNGEGYKKCCENCVWYEGKEDDVIHCYSHGELQKSFLLLSHLCKEYEHVYKNDNQQI